MTTSGLTLLRLLQLASPALPIGAYHYSQGLESAIEARLIVDPPTLESWLRDQLELNFARFEAPIFLRLYDAWKSQNNARLDAWNEQFLAACETAELRAQTVQMAQSLARLLATLDVVDADAQRWLSRARQLTLPAVYSLAAYAIGIERAEALQAYLWSWLENQVTAALKTFALGQSSAQATLFALAPAVIAAADAAAALGDDELANACPGLALLGAQHETQYSRLFRS